MELESKQKITTVIMIKEIKSHVGVCNSLVRLAELYLRKLESNNYLSSDIILRYRMMIYKTRTRVSEVTRSVLGE